MRKIFLFLFLLATVVVASASEAVVIIHQPQVGAVFCPGDVELSWDEWRLVGDQTHPTEIYLRKNNDAQFFCGISNNNSFVIKNLGEGSYTATIRAFEKMPIGVENIDPQDYFFVPVEARVGFEVRNFSSVPPPAISPVNLSLVQNYPNPFNPTTTIQYKLEKSGHTNLTIYNSTGQLVATPVNEFQESGEHQITWNAVNLPSGIYYGRLVGEGSTKILKMTLLK
ncbi:MAG TPA: T9SS type A sorting domain-containing protein [bacterium]|nr:T9SS type A sorting domain-containing protein [bacterium]